MPAAAGDEQEQYAAIGIALGDNHTVTSDGLGTAKQARRLEMRGKARVHQAAPVAGSSGGIALFGPDQHRRQRVASACAAKLFDRRRMANQAADRSQRLQMLGSGVGG